MSKATIRAVRRATTICSGARGNAAAQFAGPAIVLSFLLAGVGCALTGMCYAELAAMIPAAGSAYAFTYTALGEAAAWIIGWNLLLEYVFAASYVSVGWSGYLVSLLTQWGVPVPASLTSAFKSSRCSSCIRPVSRIVNLFPSKYFSIFNVICSLCGVRRMYGVQ